MIGINGGECCHYLGGNSMLNILICDDDKTMIEAMISIVENVLAESDKKAKIRTFTDAALVSDQILSGCDIALLDIDFEGADYNGMDIARRLRKQRSDTVLIFVTNFIEYAPEGYEVQAFRYVLKRDIHSDLKPNLLLALKNLNKETLPIQVNGEIINLVLDDILYLEVQQHNVTAVMRQQTQDKKQKEYSFYASLSELEERLEPLGFLRIHKSYLVNMKYIKKFQCREALLTNGITLRVGEKSYAENKQKYLLWKGWQ